ncbi:hypothetical protein AGMMS49587_02990 [Spirochaetia bacterium]|nr:hypothetical protein AGMMS49587_02990 [Spirochaetia bacterium]
MTEEFWTEKQKDDINFFHNNLRDFLSNPLYKLKYMVISNKQIAGVFDSFDAALIDAVSKFSPGEYIIQQVISNDETVNFLFPAIAFV